MLGIEPMCKESALTPVLSSGPFLHFLPVPVRWCSLMMESGVSNLIPSLHSGSLLPSTLQVKAFPAWGAINPCGCLSPEWPMESGICTLITCPNSEAAALCTGVWKLLLETTNQTTLHQRSGTAGYSDCPWTQWHGRNQRDFLSRLVPPPPLNVASVDKCQESREPKPCSSGPQNITQRSEPGQFCFLNAL